jgi:hypothetical protein
MQKASKKPETDLRSHDVEIVLEAEERDGKKGFGARL